MPPGTEPPEDRATAAFRARQAARAAAITLARDTGAAAVTRPAYPGAATTVRDVDPLAGLTAARNLELAARRVTRDYIRAAREAGHDWQRIGEALSLQPGREAGRSAAEAAHTYAAPAPGTGAGRRYDAAITWTCRSCDHAITDYGPVAGHADDEHGHAPDCPRHAQATAAWEAQWEAEP